MLNKKRYINFIISCNIKQTNDLVKYMTINFEELEHYSECVTYILLKVYIINKEQSYNILLQNLHELLIKFDDNRLSQFAYRFEQIINKLPILNQQVINIYKLLIVYSNDKVFEYLLENYNYNEELIIAGL